MVPTPQETAKSEMFKANQAMQIARRSNERAGGIWIYQFIRSPIWFISVLFT
ncbi:hypothetical protein CRD_02442 [Raphidiopsis brookii D9]|nr:hypothetical protein CRD_02442 [Raphidiopsis brookii D9]